MLILTYTKGDDMIFLQKPFPKVGLPFLGYLRRFFWKRRFLFFFFPSRKTMSDIANPAMLHSFSIMSSHFIPLFVHLLSDYIIPKPFTIVNRYQEKHPPKIKNPCQSTGMLKA